MPIEGPSEKAKNSIDSIAKMKARSEVLSVTFASLICSMGLSQLIAGYCLRT
jgi:hypothetical protein